MLKVHDVFTDLVTNINLYLNHFDSNLVMGNDFRITDPEHGLVFSTGVCTVVGQEDEGSEHDGFVILVQADGIDFWLAGVLCTCIFVVDWVFYVAVSGTTI